MFKNKIKLICFDLDGTLIPVGLNPMYDLNQSTILEIKKKGIECIITTGRSFERSFPYAWAINSKYLVAYSGAIIFELPEQKIIWKKTMDKSVFEKINKILELNPKIFGLLYLLNEETGQTITLKKNEINDEFREHKIILKKINSWKYITTTSNFLRFNLFASWKELQKIELELSKLNLTIINNKNTLFEITSKNARKNDSVEFLINKKLNISSSEVMAFGDSLNDLSLFKTIKYGIAVENAQQTLKDVAFDICEDFKIPGVGKYLYDKFLKN